MARGKFLCWTILFMILSGASLYLLYTHAPLPNTVQTPPIARHAGQTAPLALPESLAPPKPTTPSEPPASPYDFSAPAPQTQAVELDYFDNAAFVGDSRTDGLLLYSGIGRGKNFTANGLSIFDLKEKKYCTINGQDYSLFEAMTLANYGKIYLSLGVNELGYGDDDYFYRSYGETIDLLKRLQPQATIYLQGLIPLNEQEIVQGGGRAYLKNIHLRAYNDLIAKLAQEKQVIYLDVFTAFADESGQLPAGKSRDGVHLLREGYVQWLDYLRTHTVNLPQESAQTAPSAIGREETIT